MNTAPRTNLRARIIGTPLGSPQAALTALAGRGLSHRCSDGPTPPPARAKMLVFALRARRGKHACTLLAHDDRDIDLYHWSSTKFSAAWLDTLSVLVARGRAQVGVAAATADWPKRIRDMRYADQEDRGTAD